MYKRPTKKQQRIQRTLTFILMVSSIVIIAFGAILFILGYRLDNLNGRIEQGALVQFDSTPAGARVFIDGQQIGQTPNKRSILAGTHDFMMTRDGYHDWHKRLSLESGTLTWLDYVRMVPRELPVDVISRYETVSDVMTSPDFRSIIIHEAANSAQFDLVDISDRSVVTTELEIPAEVYSQSDNQELERTFRFDAWDASGRYALVQHTAPDINEWIVLDTQTISRSVNVSRLLSVTLSDLQFAGTSGSILYGLNDGVIRKIDVADATLSRALVSNVESFEMYSTNILTYTGIDQDNPDQRVAGMYRDGDEGAQIMARSENLDQAVRISTTRYFSDDYIAYSIGDEVTVLKGRYPVFGQRNNQPMQILTTFTTAQPVDRLSFSPGGDFLVAQAGLSFRAYEVEYDRLSESALTPSDGAATPLRWLDEAYLWTVSDGTVSIREFDGQNRHDIMPVTPGFDVTLSQNGRYLYGVVQTENGFRLQRVTMIL